MEVHHWIVINPLVSIIQPFGQLGSEVHQGSPIFSLAGFHSPPCRELGMKLFTVVQGSTARPGKLCKLLHSTVSACFVYFIQFRYVNARLHRRFDFSCDFYCLFSGDVSNTISNRTIDDFMVILWQFHYNMIAI